MGAVHRRRRSSDFVVFISRIAIQTSKSMHAIRVLLIGLTLLLAYHSAAQAQGCCTVGGSSLGGTQSGVLQQNALTVSLNYQFNSLTHAYQERVRIADPQRRTASVSYFSLDAEYGLQPLLSVFMSLPFADKKREITVTNALSRFDETAEFSATGIGDVLIMLKYQLVSPNLFSPFELALGGGARLPTGSFTKEQNRSQLSIDLQPGTGATSLIGWVFAMRSFPARGLRLFGSAMYRYSGANFDGYRIGDEYTIALGGDYALNENFGVALQLRSRFAMQDYANRRTLSATGGSYHDLMSSIAYTDGPSHARVFGQLPVYRNVRGIQLTVSYLLGIEYGYTFDVSSATVPEED